MYRSNNFQTNAESGDKFTKVSYRAKPSFWSEMKNSIGAIGVGFVLISVAVCVQFWNEGRAVQTSQSLDEGLRDVVDTHGVFTTKNDGHLVHVSGMLSSTKPVADIEYGVSIQAVHLKRTVYMYQWYEETSTREVDEGSEVREETEYSYYTSWRQDLVSSRNFQSEMGHQNPEAFPVQSRRWSASPVIVGGQFHLSDTLKSKIANFKQLTPSTPPPGSHARLFDGVLYHSKNPQRPQVGDVKIEYSYAGSTEPASADSVSVVSRQRGNTFMPYRTEAGYTLDILYMCQLSAEEIFSQEHSSNNAMTWGLRGLGWLLMFIGFMCTTSILNTLVSRIPIVSHIVGIGTTAFNAASATSLSLVVIALGWIRYRPMVGLALIACSLVPIFMSRRRDERQRHD